MLADNAGRFEVVLPILPGAYDITAAMIGRVAVPRQITLAEGDTLKDIGRLHVPASMSRSTIVLLSRLIHEFMVYRALGDWLGITDAEASAKWMEKAEYTRHEIETAKNQRGVFTRRLHPW